MARPRATFLEGRRLVSLALLAALVWSIWQVQWDQPIIHGGGLGAAAVLFRALVTPELSPSFLATVLKASWHTVAYAFGGITLAVGAGFSLGVIASGVLARSSTGRWSMIVGTRGLLALMRAIHELVWAWLFVVAIGLSPMAAILALAIPYSGILGRIYSEILQDVPEEPLSALRTAGASEWQVLLYGRLPIALPDMLSYSFYRLECAIRAAAVMSFVGVAGLGFQIQISLDDLRFSEVWTLLFALVGLILLIDLWSTWVRRSLVR